MRANIEARVIMMVVNKYLNFCEIDLMWNTYMHSKYNWIKFQIENDMNYELFQILKQLYLTH